MIRKPGFWILLTGMLFSLHAYPQFNLKEKIRSQISTKANERLEQEKSQKQEPESEEKEEATAPAEEPVNEEKTEDAGNEPKPAPQAPIRSVTRYDFVPGDKVLFFEDFSQDAIGDFPALWTTNGSGEVRTVEGFPGNWLLPTSDESVYCLMKDLVPPKNFIFEFDVIAAQESEDWSHCSFYMTFFNTTEDFLNDGLVPGNGGFHLTVKDDGWEATGYNEQNYLPGSSSEIAPLKLNQLNHVIVWVQDRRLRVYHEGQKVLDGPTCLPPNATYNRFRISMWGNTGNPYFSNLKITTAAPDTRSKLLTEGKLISYGIYFDSGKDVVKPESAGALSDIAKVLKENGTVRIKITGHTDSDGNDALNLDLSKKRAAAVKNELEKNYGIEASRIETDGKGETQPIEQNTSPEGKARNRRVEFIKL